MDRKYKNPEREVVTKFINIADLAATAAVCVSNHGGRQLDSSPAAIEGFCEVAGAVNKKIPIIFDSDIYSRTAYRESDCIWCRYCCSRVSCALWYCSRRMVGRFQAFFDFLAKELSLTMQLTGCHDIGKLKKVRLR